MIKTLQTAPASQMWTLAGVVAVGLILMPIARFGTRSTFSRYPWESADMSPRESADKSPR